MGLTAGVMGSNVIEAVLTTKDETASGVNSAQKNLKKFGDTATKVGRNMMLMSTLVTGGMYMMSKSTYDYGEAHLKVAKQTGLTVEQSQKLAYAAEQEFADFDTLTRSLPILTKYMGYARDGMDTYKREFDKMGITVTDSEGNLRSVYDVFMEMSDYMSDNGISAQEKTATAMGLLGRRGAELVPFLGLGRKGLEELGVELENTRGVMSQAEAETMKRFNDNLLKLKTTMAGIKDTIAIGVLPVFEKLIAWGQTFTQWFKDLSPEMQGFLAKFAFMASIGVGVLGTGLLVSGMLAKMAVGMITLAKATGLMNAAGSINIGVLTGMTLAAGKLLLIMVGILAAEEALMSLKGIWQAHLAGKETKGRGATADEIRRALAAGEITTEEAKKRAAGIAIGGKEAGTYNKTWGMTGLERIGYEVGRFQQIQANISVTKETEIGEKINQVMRPIVTGT